MPLLRLPTLRPAYERQGFPRRAPLPKLGGMRLLVVEDTEDLADALVRYLRAEGHAVDHVVTAAEAAAAFGVADYAAAVVDLGLPDGSGLDLLRDERSRGNRTPILIATARDRVSDRIAGLDAGADDYIVKPFDLAEVSARIRARRAWARMRAQPRCTSARCAWTSRGDGSSRPKARSGSPRASGRCSSSW